MNALADPVGPDSRLLACFQLGADRFAVGAPLVREVVTRFDVNPVHTAPSHIQGAVNLRGQIVTVIDLHSILGVGAARAKVGPQLVVLRSRSEYAGKESEGLVLPEDKVGWIVDRLDDVTAAPAGELEAPPATVHGVVRSLLSCVWKRPESSVAVIDVKALLARAEEEAGSSVEGSPP